MPTQPTTAPSEERPGALMALALWAGMVTGFAELAVMAKALIGPDFAKMTRDAVWMVPAFDGVAFGVIGLLMVAIGRRFRIPWHVAAGMLAGFGTFLVLLLVPMLHVLAALAVGAGVGAQVGRVLTNRVAAASSVVRRSLPWLAASVVVLAVVTLGWRAVRERWLVRNRPTAQAGAPNILLLILDTVRAADLSLYGYARLTTPQIERFAERGTVFDLAFSPAPWTLESHASMFTGRWALELETTGRHSLGGQWLTLAEALRDQGYATAGFVANRVYTGWESGLAQGFERFEDYPVNLWSASNATALGKLRFMLDPYLNHVPLLWRLHIPPGAQKRKAPHINQAFLSWLDQARPAPFFAFLNFMEAHLMYAPPDSFRYRFRTPLVRPISPKAWGLQPDVRLTPADMRPKQDVYDGSIAYLDSEIGWLLRELERRDQLKNTLVIITSDHGEEFAEHGLIDHGNSLYRLSLWVPLVLWYPGHVPEGRRVTAPVSLRNLAATIMELAVPGTAPLPGRSLTRFWTTADAAPDTIVASVSQTGNLPAWFPVSRNDLFSVAFDGWRYIRTEEDSTEELYDFDHDVLERWNVAGSEAGQRVLPQYRGALAGLREAAKPPQLQAIRTDP